MHRGYPSSPDPEFTVITPWGQFTGAIIMVWVLGFAPAILVTRFLTRLDVLRIPIQIDLVGLDILPQIEVEEAAKKIIEAERKKPAKLESIEIRELEKTQSNTPARNIQTACINTRKPIRVSICNRVYRAPVAELPRCAP